MLVRPAEPYPFYHQPAWFGVRSATIRGPPLTNPSAARASRDARNSWCPPDFESWFSAATPETATFWDCRPMAGGRFAFDVQTAHSAHIALSSGPLDSVCSAASRPSRASHSRAQAREPEPEAADTVFPEVYEIVIAQKRTYTALLRGGVEVAVPGRHCELRELRGDAWRGFWVHVGDDGCIQFGRRGEAEPLLEWADPTPFTPKFVAFYSGPGSGGGQWRFYSPRGVPQPSTGNPAVFSYRLDTCPEVGTPFALTIHGANLAVRGDRLKIVAGAEWIHEGPAAGSTVVRNLEGTDTTKTATVTFTEPSKRELVVAYNPGTGYEVVRPDRTNAYFLMPNSVVRPVTSTSEHLLQPLRKPSPAAEPPPSKVLSSKAEGSLLRRLYRPRRAATPLPPPETKVLSLEAEDALFKRLCRPSPAVVPPRPPPESKALTWEAEDALVKRLHDQPLEAQKVLRAMVPTFRPTRQLKTKEQAKGEKKFHKYRVDRVVSEAKDLEQNTPATALPAAAAAELLP
eukprot:EG_transcript_2217